MELKGKRAQTLRVAYFAYASLVPLFAFDVFTPQLLAAEITYEIPVMLAAFTGDRKLTYRLLLCALLTTEIAAILDAAADHFRWDAIGIENRALSILSLLIVAALTLAVQRASERLGRAAALEGERRRATALSVAADHVLAALSNRELDATVLREAAAVFGTDRVFWQPASDAGGCWTLREGRPARGAIGDLPPAVVTAMSQAAGAEHIEFAEHPQAGRTCLLQVPAGDAGVLLAVLPDGERSEETRLAAATFRRLVLGAFDQARLTTDLVARNAALNEKQGVIEGLIDAIAHDLRTPLSALAVTLQQASDGAYGALPGDYDEVLRESRTSIEDIRALAETLLVVARLEGGTLAPRGHHVRLDVIARELTSEFRALAASRNIEIVTHAEEGAVAVADRGDLRRAVANLLVNAIQHTPGQGTVRLDVHRNGASIDVVVADDGYGIDERVRPHLFERFSRGAAIGSGTGLGLYIVRRVAEEAGGAVRYEPAQPRGSRFTLSLPRAA
jgi:signal transduction histidine kinase